MNRYPALRTGMVGGLVVQCTCVHNGHVMPRTIVRHLLLWRTLTRTYMYMYMYMYVCCVLYNDTHSFRPHPHTTVCSDHTHTPLFVRAGTSNVVTHLTLATNERGTPTHTQSLTQLYRHSLALMHSHQYRAGLTSFTRQCQTVSWTL